MSVSAPLCARAPVCLWLISSAHTCGVFIIVAQIKQLACVTRYDLELAVEYDAEISRAGGYEPVRKTHLSLLRCHFILKNNHFTKTGSGQT